MELTCGFFVNSDENKAKNVPCFRRNGIAPWNDENSLPYECHLHYLLERHIFGIIPAATNGGRGWHGHFFCSWPRTGASGKNVPPPTAIIMVRRFRRKKPFVFFFLMQPVPGTPRHACKMFRAKLSKIWLRRANIKSYLSPENDPILKLIKGNYARLYIFSAQKSDSPNRL